MMSEAEVQSRIMMEAAKHGIILWRNNSGAFKDETGRMVYYGLGVISKQQNSRIKSSDLIGIYPWSSYIRGVNNKPEALHAGLFIAIEVKREGWKYNPNDEREQAQKAFIDFVISKGGIAGFAASVDDFLKLIGKQ